MAKSAVQSRYVSTIRDVSVQVNGLQSDSVPSHGRTCPGDDHVTGDVTVTRTRPSSPHECCRQRDIAAQRTTYRAERRRILSKRYIAHGKKAKNTPILGRSCSNPHRTCDSRLQLLSSRPAVTIPVAEHRRLLASTKVYCLLIQHHHCKT